MEKYTITLGELIENDFKLFDFDYPIFSEDYKKIFEQNFIDHFYYDEIGLETPSRFKHRLMVKLRLIMPYWNKVIMADNLEQRILDNYDVTETYTRNLTNNVDSVNKATNKNISSSNGVTKADINEVDFVDGIVKDIGDSTNNTKGNSKEEWTRKMQGNIGVQTDADAVIKYWTSLRQIELEIFEECNDLFMGVY